MATPGCLANLGVQVVKRGQTWSDPFLLAPFYLYHLYPQIG